MKKSIPYKVLKTSNCIGLSFLDDVIVSYTRLVELFGEPQKGDEYKVDAEWIIRFKNSCDYTCHIYNYKTGKNYLGDNGKDVEDISIWHIGGTNREVVYLIEEVLNS